MNTKIIKRIVYTGALSFLLTLCVPSCKKLDEYNPTSYRRKMSLEILMVGKHFNQIFIQGFGGRLSVCSMG